MGVGQVRLEVNGLLKETDGIVIVFLGVQYSAQGDAQIRIDGVESDSLTVRSDGPGVRTLGKIEQVPVDTGQIFQIGNLSGINSHGIFGFPDSLLDQLGDGVFVGVGEPRSCGVRSQGVS